MALSWAASARAGVASEEVGELVVAEVWKGVEGLDSGEALLQEVEVWSAWWT